mmetsp:Transcript_76471/g.216769  ORF Transcript_76471/g.216769 Transcript_76471/m.216769 type:complete len:229 (+) Transcript_76471:736-1422(+)
MGLAVVLYPAQRPCRARAQRQVLPPLLARPVRWHRVAHGARDAALRALGHLPAGAGDEPRGAGLPIPRPRPAGAALRGVGPEGAGAAGCRRTPAPGAPGRPAGAHAAARRDALAHAALALPGQDAHHGGALPVRGHRVPAGGGDRGSPPAVREPAGEAEGEPGLPARLRQHQRPPGLLRRRRGLRGEGGDAAHAGPQPAARRGTRHRRPLRGGAVPRPAARPYSAAVA